MGFLTVIWTFGLCVLFGGFIRKCLKWKQWANKIDLIPGPPKLPLLGNALQITSNREEFAYEIGEKIKTYGSVFRLWYGLNPSVGICKAEHAEIIMGGSKHVEKSIIYEFLATWLGDGLIMSKGAKWHSRRKLITPAFHFKILENFHHVFKVKADILVNKLGKYCELKQPFNIYSFISHATLDVICEAAMGIDINAQGERQSDYINSTYKIADALTYRSRRISLYPQFIYDLTKHGRNYRKLLDVLHGFTSKVIAERRANRQNKINSGEFNASEDVFGSKKRFAFLDLLLESSENGAELNEAAIREEVDNFMFAGHDTAASGISWTLYLLGCHPQYQDLVVQELEDIFQGEDRPITLKDVNEMKYLDRVIKESIRLCPPVPMIARKVEEDVEFDGYVIPAGAYVDIFIYYIHRDPRFFPDPEKFDPDRFSPENCEKRHPFAYIPFSAGPRNCIGQKFVTLEEKFFLASILRKFKISSMEKLEDMRVLFELALRPINGFNVKLEKRLKQTQL